MSFSTAVVLDESASVTSKFNTHLLLAFGLVSSPTQEELFGESLDADDGSGSGERRPPPLSLQPRCYAHLTHLSLWIAMLALHSPCSALVMSSGFADWYLSLHTQRPRSSVRRLQRRCKWHAAPDERNGVITVPNCLEGQGPLVWATHI